MKTNLSGWVSGAIRSPITFCVLSIEIIYWTIFLFSTAKPANAQLLNYCSNSGGVFLHMVPKFRDDSTWSERVEHVFRVSWSIEKSDRDSDSDYVDKSEQESFIPIISSESYSRRHMYQTYEAVVNLIRCSCVIQTSKINVCYVFRNKHLFQCLT